MGRPSQPSSPNRPSEIVERALTLSRGDGCVVILDESSSANLRWAGNALTTNGLVHDRTLTVISTLGGARGTACGVVARGAVGLDDVEALIRQAEAAARSGTPAEDAEPLIPPSGAATTDPPCFEAPAATTSIEELTGFAAGLREVLAGSAAGGRLCYGFARQDRTSSYLASSTGLRLRHDQPTATLELTVRSADGSASAWDGAAGPALADLDPVAGYRRLEQRLDWSRRTVALPPGRYETLLPPSALADLMIYLYWTAGARDAAEGRTVFSRPGGGTRIGDRLTARSVTLRSDPAEPGLQAAPFLLARSSESQSSVFDNGLPIAATPWIRDGVLTELVSTRHSAGLTGLPIRPPVDNLILQSDEGADRAAPPDLDQLIERTGRGLLLTCLWYVREVDPTTLLLTGLTRDGVYLVEGGEVVAAVNNFRFNESPVDLLARAVEFGPSERCLGRDFGEYFPRTAMPTVRVPDFNMSSVSEAS
jgi:predicted Zn-dependent protease